MHIHLPKVPHSWREIAKEIAIIVIGVLIALTAEQIVESWHWHRKVQVAEDQMRYELLYDDAPQIYQRAAMHPCVVAKLNAIRTAVESGRPRGEVAQLIGSYWLDFRTFDRLALDAANSSDIAAHMPPDELSALTTAYEIMPLLERTNAQEAADIARLKSLRRTGGALSDQEQAQVLQAVEALRYDDQIIWTRAQTKLPTLRRIGPFDPQRVAKFMADARDHYGACIKDLP